MLGWTPQTSEIATTTTSTHYVSVSLPLTLPSSFCLSLASPTVLLGSDLLRLGPPSPYSWSTLASALFLPHTRPGSLVQYVPTLSSSCPHSIFNCSHSTHIHFSLYANPPSHSVFFRPSINSPLSYPHSVPTQLLSSLHPLAPSPHPVPHWSRQ